MFNRILSRVRRAAARRRWWRLPLGTRGERVAARWLVRHGYRILETNMTIGRDEADLVALAPDGAVVIVEVKTRADPAARPEAAIDGRKRHRMERLAARLRGRKGFADRALRFEAIAVTWPREGRPRVRHFANVFG